MSSLPPPVFASIGIARFLSVVSACLLVVAAQGTAAAAQTAGTSSERDWRRSAVERPRRVIFNNDGNEPVTIMRRPSVEDMLAARTTPLAGTHVDAIFYCTFSAGFGNFTHFTKVGQVHTIREGQFANNQMSALLEAGIDPLRVMVDFAHANKMECFWSMRMNDTHDAAKTGPGLILFNCNALKKAHPEYLISTAEKLPKHGAWSSVNYGRAEIRELAFRYVEEVCKNYDVDGVELDFFRHPVFFPTAAEGNPATDEELGQMTGLMRRIRTMADAVGRARGRPILIAMRVPDSVGFARVIGLDIERWLAEDLMDLMVVSSYIQLNEWETSVALGRKYGVKVYPSLDESRLKDKASAKARAADAGYRGRAMNVWGSGADGVYLFNQFNPKRKIWSELGDPKVLAGLDRDYFASARGVGAVAGRSFPHGDFQKVETLNPSAPKVLRPGAPAVTAGLTVGEELDKTAAGKKLSLRLRLNRDQKGAPLEVKLNGTALVNPLVEDDWLVFSPKAEAFRKGRNEVSLQLGAGAKRPINLLDLVLQVRAAR